MIWTKKHENRYQHRIPSESNVYSKTIQLTFHHPIAIIFLFDLIASYKMVERTSFYIEASNKMFEPSSFYLEALNEMYERSN